MFKKNSIEFFIRLLYYLYYFTEAVYAKKTYNYMFFPECSIVT